MKKGECYIDTGFGTVDSSLEIQLQAVESTLRELLGQFDEKISICRINNFYKD